MINLLCDNDIDIFVGFRVNAIICVQVSFTETDFIVENIILIIN